VRSLAIFAAAAVLAGCAAPTPPVGAADSGAADAGALDAGAVDAGPLDAGPADAGPGSAADGGWVSGARVWRSVEGGRYELYVPTSFDGTARPLVVMLHGCTQDPNDFAKGTQMDVLAEREDFVVAWPEQPASANAYRCWNWYLPADQARGAGEPAFLARVVADVQGVLPVDARRIYAAGLSAGAAMAVTLGATYPDLFAAVASHSGVEYAAATDASSALTVEIYGATDPVGHGDLAYAAMGAAAREVPVLIIQGSADTTVNPNNATALVGQWAQTDTRAGGSVTTTSPDAETLTVNGLSYTRSQYLDAQTGATAIELYQVAGLGHAWMGGDPYGTYTDSRGPSASELVWGFFAAHPK